MYESAFENFLEPTPGLPVRSIYPKPLISGQNLVSTVFFWPDELKVINRVARRAPQPDLGYSRPCLFDVQRRADDVRVEQEALLGQPGEVDLGGVEPRSVDTDSQVYTSPQKRGGLTIKDKLNK